MLKRESGKDALRLSEGITRYKKMDRQEESPNQAFRTIEGHSFVQVNGIWIDEAYDESKMKDKAIKVKFGSDEYFDLLEKKPGLQKFFVLGEQVIVVLDEQAYIVEPAA